MEGFIGEFIGTTLLILIGNGVIANVLLNKTKGHDAGWAVLGLGWAMAVFMGVYASTFLGGGGHLNPVVTMAFALLTDFPKEMVLPYIIAQFLGAAFGSILVWIAYKDHFDETHDGDAKLAVFCTAPAIRNSVMNVWTEAIATAILVMGVFLMNPPEVNLGTISALPAGLLVLGLILALSGPTGLAINPARDLAPRIVHYFLPLQHKRDSDWNYAWVPVVGPILGGLAAVMILRMITI